MVNFFINRAQSLLTQLEGIKKWDGSDAERLQKFHYVLGQAKLIETVFTNKITSTAGLEAIRRVIKLTTAEIGVSHAKPEDQNEEETLPVDPEAVSHAKPNLEEMSYNEKLKLVTELGIKLEDKSKESVQNALVSHFEGVANG